jgi:hypothetical protein
MHCGSELPQDGRFCSRCGAAIPAYQPPVNPAPGPIPGQYGVPGAGNDATWGTRVGRHIQALSLLWAVYAAYRFATKMFGLTLFHTFVRHSHAWNANAWGYDWMDAIMPVAITALLVSTALSLLAAYGLYTRQTWGRVVAIVCAVWSLIHPVLGTVLGIYTLWVLAPAISGMEYDNLVRANRQI